MISTLNITLTGEQGTSPQDIIEVLNSIVDCQKECQLSSISQNIESTNSDMRKPVYLMEPTDDFAKVYYKLGLIGRVKVQLYNKDNLEECDFCGIISESESFSSKVINNPLVQGASRVAKKVVSLLEPDRWIKLIVGVWLTVCLIIAMLIKRRDRRHLRLYLEERADYSFSAKR